MVQVDRPCRTMCRVGTACVVVCASSYTLCSTYSSTAPPDVIEGKFGFYAQYQAGDPAVLMHELGQRFDNDQASIKLYPSCGCNHTAIDATLQLVTQSDLKPDDVLGIEATITPYMERIVGGDYDPSGDAQVAAQFNLRYSIACALVRRRLGLA